jgi:hypothetical protein
MAGERTSRSVAHARERAVAARRERRAARRERRLTAAAFHEAGHAVAAYHLRVRLRRISIGADEGEALGWLDLWLPRVTSGDGGNVRLAQAVERDLVVLWQVPRPNESALAAAAAQPAASIFMKLCAGRARSAEPARK